MKCLKYSILFWNKTDQKCSQTFISREFSCVLPFPCFRKKTYFSNFTKQFAKRSRSAKFCKIRHSLGMGWPELDTQQRETNWHLTVSIQHCAWHIIYYDVVLCCAEYITFRTLNVTKTIWINVYKLQQS